MMNKKPFITIGIPVYNRCELLKICVESVLTQTFKDFEIIIVDNKSTDGTWEYMNSIKDSRVKIFQNSTNIGAIANWRKCVEYATGSFFKIVMSDDILSPNALFILHSVFKKFNKQGLPVINQSFSITENIQSISVSDEYEVQKRKTKMRVEDNKRMLHHPLFTPGNFTVRTEDYLNLINTIEYKLVEKELGRTGPFVDQYIFESILNKHRFYFEISKPEMYGYRSHKTNVSKTAFVDIAWFFSTYIYIYMKLYKFNVIEKFQIFNIFLTRQFLSIFIRSFVKHPLKTIFKLFNLIFFMSKEVFLGLNKLYITEEKYLNQQCGLQSSNI